MTYTLTLDDASPAVRVRTASGRAYTTSQHALGLALMASALPGEDPAGSWTDYLHSHGLAIFHSPQKQMILGVLPARARDLPNADGTVRSVTFPPLLGGVLLQRGAHVRSVLYIVDLSKQATFSVTSAEHVLTPFPYGNVYTPSGMICWGQVSPRPVVSIKTLEDLFFSSGFNSDLVIPEYLPRGVGSMNAVVTGTTLRAPTSFGRSIRNAISALQRSE